MSKVTVTIATSGLRARAVSAAVFACVAAIVSGCETSSTVSETAPTSLNKCQVALTTPPMIDASGGRATVSVTTQPECAWTASSAVNWISGVAPGSGQGTRDFEFQVAANPDVTLREGDIVVNDNRVRVSQRAACRYVLTPATQTVGASGGDATVNVAAGPECAWTATTDVGWITLNQPGSGTGNGTVGFRVDVNGPTERVGTIIVAGQRVTITQAAIGIPCTFAISPVSQHFVAAGGASTINVSTQNNCRWTARSNHPWITVTSDSNGNGNGAVNFRVAANTGAARTGTLSIENVSFTVTQAEAGAACSYTINPTSQNAPAGGGSGSVSVATASTCAWTAVSNATWITVTSGAAGTGNGPVAYAIAANTGAARMGTVTIAGQAFTVNQAAAAASCTYSISPGTQQIARVGGVVTVTVTTASGCAWTAVSNAGWIVISTGASGSGNGTVTAAVAANTGGQRNGTLTVAGQTATIQQGAN